MTTNNNSNTGRPTPTTFIRVQNPARDMLFQAIAPSTTYIRTARGSITTTCSQCFKHEEIEGAELRKCLRCKSVWYCSKECQREHWAVHKETCRDVERSLAKLIKHFVANPILLRYLEVCLILDFNLVDNPAPNTPFMARVDVGLQPSDINVFHRMCTGWYAEGQEAEPERIEGIFQVNAVTASPPNISPYPHRLLTWKQTRDQLCADGQASTPVIILEFISNNYQGSTTIMLPISSTSLTIAKKKEPFITFIKSRQSREPMSAVACLNFINHFIRADSNNQLLLRMNMREEDKKVIRALSRGEDTTAVNIVKSKLGREKIYVYGTGDGSED